MFSLVQSVKDGVVLVTLTVHSKYLATDSFIHKALSFPALLGDGYVSNVSAVFLAHLRDFMPHAV